MQVFVVGAGIMGAGIAQIFAQSGNQVWLCDMEPALVDKGIASIEKGLDRLVAKGKMEATEKDALLSRIHKTTDYAAAKDCSLVIEAIIEKMEAKRAIFTQLDAVCAEDTLFASNTSSLSITEMSLSVKRRENFLGMHFFNPAPVMKLVELIRGMETSDATLNRAKEISLSVGKQPIEVKESPAFVVNRLLVPMINEAVGVLAEGIASVEDIDQAMMLGANHPIGPLALSDMIGNDIILAAMEVLLQETGDSKYRPHPLLRKMVRAGHLGKKTGKGFYTH